MSGGYPFHLFNTTQINAISMGATITSDALNVQEAISYSVQAVWTGGSYESFTVTCLAAASTTQADYLSFSEPDGTTFAAWFDIDAAGTAPTGAIYTAATNKIECDIVTGDTAAQVATKLKAAIEANGAFDEYVITINSAVLTFTANAYGNPTNAAPHNANDSGAGSLVVVVTSGTATPVGTFDLKGSNDGTNFTSVLSSPVAVSGSTGNLLINVEKHAYAYIQLVYTRTSGEGTLTAIVNGKQG